MEILNILFAFVILFCLALCWFGFHYLTNKPLANPDGHAIVTGNCGDTMEISLQFKDGRVCNSSAWTNGCSVSKTCVEAAVMLARNRQFSEIKKINMMTIMEHIGQLPESHLHCAQLAETTLLAALKNYRMSEQQKNV
ncbi:MAG: iron-sulfur cluster assembly scaffold protein [Proteobacteria bacterium]|nr:iron-sulfur cluster assembly scaffold protein [Pseudomonadota bacterium]